MSIRKLIAPGTQGALKINVDQINVGGSSTTEVSAQFSGDPLLIPRLTTAQRNTIVAIYGMIIYNTDTGTFQFRQQSGGWVDGGSVLSSILLTALSNQITVGTGTTITMNFFHPNASRVYDVPDVLGNAEFIMSRGAQTIGGDKTLSGITSITNATASTSTTTGALIVTGGIGCAGNIYPGGLVLPSTGAVVAGNLNYYEKSWNGVLAFIGPFNTGNVDITITKIGNVATIRMATFAGASAAPLSFASTSVLPDRFHPTADLIIPAWIMTNSVSAMGSVVIYTNGAVEIFAGDFGATFSAVGNAGFQGTTTSYLTA